MVRFLKGAAGSQNSLKGAGAGGGAAAIEIREGSFASNLITSSVDDYAADLDISASTHEAGDLLIAGGLARAAFDSPLTGVSQAGWTEVDSASSSGGIRIHYKISDGTETGVTVTDCRSGGSFFCAIKGCVSPNATDLGNAVASYVAATTTDETLAAMTDRTYDSVFSIAFSLDPSANPFIPTPDGVFQGLFAPADGMSMFLQVSEGNAGSGSITLLLGDPANQVDFGHFRIGLRL